VLTLRTVSGGIKGHGKNQSTRTKCYNNEESWKRENSKMKRHRGTRGTSG